MSKPHGTKELWLSSLAAEANAFAATVDQEGALDLPVPSCPGWAVSDLVQHLGQWYYFVRSHVSTGLTSRPERHPDGLPSPDGGLPSWWRERYQELRTILDQLDPQRPAWNWAPQPKVANFWFRRVAHETAVHRWDAQIATGRATPIESRLAADGVTEVLDTWLASGRWRKSPIRPGMLALRATDVDAVWYVRLRHEGIALLDTDTLLDDDDHHERATANGTASDLLLAMYGRIGFDVLETSGDIGLFQGLRTG